MKKFNNSLVTKKLSNLQADNTNNRDYISRPLRNICI